jgi:hypothetical protein
MLTLPEHLVDMKYYFYHYTCWTGNVNPSGTPGGQEILPLPIHLLDRKSRPFRNTWWTKILTLPKHAQKKIHIHPYPLLETEYKKHKSPSPDVITVSGSLTIYVMSLEKYWNKTFLNMEQSDFIANAPGGHEILPPPNYLLGRKC